MGINSNKWNKIRYSLYQPIYDQVAGAFSKQRKRSIALLDLQPGEKVLILGAGTGLDLEFMQENVNITAIDLTPAMVSTMKKRAGNLGLKGEFLVMDGQDLKFKEEIFDCVILHLILAVIPDPYKCISEVERVLKPGGRGVIFDKFVADSQEPSFPRRILNLFTNILFSDINRRLKDILETTKLRKVKEEAAGFGGNFKIVVFEK